MTGPRAKISVAIKILLNERIESEFESATVSLTEEIPSERQGFATFRTEPSSLENRAARRKLPRDTGTAPARSSSQRH